MSKAYLVYKSYGYDDSIIVGAFLDEKQADKYVFEHRKQRAEEEKQYKKCRKCRRCDNKKYDDNNEYFDLRNKCDKAEIRKDRNGKYCKNDSSDYYDLKADDYWKNEVNLLDVTDGEILKDNWDVTSKILSQVVSKLKNSIESVKALDSALTELNKVSNIKLQTIKGE